MHAYCQSSSQLQNLIILNFGGLATSRIVLEIIECISEGESPFKGNKLGQLFIWVSARSKGIRSRKLRLWSWNSLVHKMF